VDPELISKSAAARPGNTEIPMAQIAAAEAVCFQRWHNFRDRSDALSLQ
jgi:hypothetical protein